MLIHFRKFAALLVFLGSSVPVIAADAIYKVGEVNIDRTQSHSNHTQGQQYNNNSGAYFLELTGAGYFVARDGTGDDHDKLWRTDGTPAGTTLVRALPLPTVRAAVKSGSILYYLLSGSIFGGALMVRSDGTAAGTYPLAIDVLEMADVNGTLYYSTLIGVANYTALYKTGGTQASTVKIKDFGGLAPQYLANVSGVLFFNGDDGVNGRELWKSDGTQSGTVMVRDIRLAPQESGDPRMITASGGKAYFSASGLPGQLWVSDGTELGTLMLINFTDSNNPNPEIRHLTDLNGTLIAFIGGLAYGNLKIYKSNGTPPTTVIADPGPFGLFLPRHKDWVTTVGDTMYFIGGERAGSSAGFVYKTSGGAATQVSNAYINGQNPVGTGARATAPILAVGNTVYFGNSPDNTVSIEVAAITHNVAGSERYVADINPASNSPIVPYDFAAFNGKLFFTQDNSVTGISPYVTDGTTTTLLKDVNATTMGAGIPPDLTAVGGGKFFFVANSSSGSKLFFTSGTGVTLISEGSALRITSKLAGFGGGAYFGAQSPAGIGLHFTDGSTPVLIKAFSNNVTISVLQPVGATLYFAVDNSGIDKQLWKSDGTPTGTVMVKSFTKSGNISEILSSNGVTFMVANDGTTGHVLWRTNGTEAGTVVVNYIHDAGSSISSESYNGKYSYFLPFSGGVYFKVRGSAPYSDSFYKSNGTDIGTVEIVSKAGLPFGGEMLGVSNGLLYYRGAYIHTFNGTSSAEILRSSPSGAFADVGGTAFFGTGEGMYKSTGTADTTTLLLPGTSSVAREYTSFAGKLFFTRNTAEAGNELWRSDGTAAGTFMVQDLLPGSKDGITNILQPVNGALMLSGRNTVDNAELFATLATSTAITRPTVTTQTVYGIVGKPLSYQVQFTGANVTLYSNEGGGVFLSSGPRVYARGFVPGASFNPVTGIISGTPIESGLWSFQIVAQNEGGTAFATILFDISPPIGLRLLDIDGDGIYDACTDGMLSLRYLFGLTGEALTQNIGSPVQGQQTKCGAGAPTRTTPEEILQRLNYIRSALDIDGNGTADALTDGLLLIRYLSGLRGATLIAGVIGKGATRFTAPDIEAYILSIMP